MMMTAQEKKQEAVAGVGMLVAAFTNEEAGEEALKALKQAKKERQIYFEEAAVIKQDADGEVHYHETGDMTAGKGAGIGALVGGVIGILGGPAGIAIGAGAGALLGGLASKGDAGYGDDSLEQLGVALQPGTSAIAIITSSAFLKAMRKYGDEEQIREAVTNLADGISANLAEGNNVALGLLITEAGVAVEEVVANEEAVHVIGAVSTEEGWAAAEALVTEEGVAARRVVGTDEVVAGEGFVATEEGAVAGRFVATEDEAVAEVVEVLPEDEEEQTTDE
jgi:uncharacterized membrane protein